MPDDRLILFLHVPKTAGLTLRVSILPRQYKAVESLYAEWGGKAWTDDAHAVGAYDDDLGSTAVFDGVVKPGVLWYPESIENAAARYYRLSPKVRARLRVMLTNHVEYGLHERLDRPVSYFTVLRQPVSRVLSHYGMARERQVPEGMGLAEHIADCVEVNLQTRMLAGLARPDPALPPEEMLRRAQEHLRTCTVVGLTERFDETLMLLKKAYGWRMPLYERVNVAKKRLSRHELPPETVRQMEADNALDLALYATAKELFAEQMRAYGPSLRRDVRWFRIVNWAWQRWRLAATRLARAARAVARPTLYPVYEALARWGGFRRLLPSRYAPRVTSRVEGTHVFFWVQLGQRVVGFYDPRRGSWKIQPPFRLFVDVRSLPGVRRAGSHFTKLGTKSRLESD